MTKKQIRRKEIIKTLQLRNGATIKELASLLNVSEMTIRRDLQSLEAEGIINLVHGAAIYNPQSLTVNRLKEYDLLTAKTIYNEEKNRIGKYAAGIIQNNELVIFDGGSTIEKIMLNISNEQKFTAYCYSANILIPILTNPNVKKIVGGGEYKDETMMFLSHKNLDVINTIRASKVFVSAAGIDENFGVTSANLYEEPFKKAIMNASIEKILVVDSSKFGRVEESYFAEITDFSTIITDKNLSSDWIDKIEKTDVKLILV